MPDSRSPTLIAIAVAFRDGLRDTGDQAAAFDSALRTYRSRHADRPAARAEEAVALLIAQAGEEFGPWLFGREQKPKPRTLRLGGA